MDRDLIEAIVCYVEMHQSTPGRMPRYEDDKRVPEYVQKLIDEGVIRISNATSIQRYPAGKDTSSVRKVADINRTVYNKLYKDE